MTGFSVIEVRDDFRLDRPTTRDGRPMGLDSQGNDYDSTAICGVLLLRPDALFSPPSRSSTPCLTPTRIQAWSLLRPRM